MKCRRTLLRVNVLLAALLAMVAADSSHADTVPRPNIVVILVDDLGFSDLSCYGGEIPTPHLDALATNGLRFSQAYNCGRCCPTRASLLTGLYPHQAGVGHMTKDDELPGYRGRLGEECPTIAEALHAAGYFTAISGKWHVGQNHGVTPWTRGFDRNLSASAGGFYFAESPMLELWLGADQLSAGDSRLPADWYSTDLWTAFGLQFVDQARAADKPFFLYLAHNAPHFPLQAPADSIAEFRGRYREGWDVLARQRAERQRALGLLGPDESPAGRPDTVASWDTLSLEERERFDHLMAVYAATVHRMDRAVGEFVAGLRERGLLDDTLILFQSDNGGNAETGPAGRTEGDPTQARSGWFCGESWAFLQNVPFQRFKHFAHEGGVATPLIAHWPRGIASRGQWRHQPAHVIDILPTCLEAAAAAPLEARGSRPAPPLEGVSLVPAFRDEPLRRDTLFWEHEGNAAIRERDLKLVRLWDDGPWELYDLSVDRTEQRDLAGDRPDEVRRLADRWETWARRVNAVPRPPGQPAYRTRAARAAPRPATAGLTRANVLP